MSEDRRIPSQPLGELYVAGLPRRRELRCSPAAIPRVKGNMEGACAVPEDLFGGRCQGGAFVSLAQGYELPHKYRIYLFDSKFAANEFFDSLTPSKSQPRRPSFPLDYQLQIEEGTAQAFVSNELSQILNGR
jgi:hypothetical protein